MNGLRTQLARRLKDLFHIEIGFQRGPTAQGIRLIRQKNGKRVPIVLRVYDGRPNAQLPAGAYDANRNLSAIGN